MRKLTILKVINSYQGTKGLGTLIIFNELHEDGDFKGKNIVTWNADANHVPESVDGWTLDDEGRINPPLVTKKALREEELRLKFTLIQEAGIEVRV